MRTDNNMYKSFPYNAFNILTPTDKGVLNVKLHKNTEEYSDKVLIDEFDVPYL